MTVLALLLPRTVVLKPGNAVNYNMRTAAGNPVGPVVAICLAEGAITSANSTLPALTTGEGWGAGSVLMLINKGTITGAQGAAGTNGDGDTGSHGAGGGGGVGDPGGGGNSGGAGQRGGDGFAGNGGAGKTGGAGLRATRAIILRNSGTIAGGVGGLGGVGGVGTGGSGGGGGGGAGGGVRLTQTCQLHRRSRRPGWATFEHRSWRRFVEHRRRRGAWWRWWRIRIVGQLRIVCYRHRCTGGLYAHQPQRRRWRCGRRTR